MMKKNKIFKDANEWNDKNASTIGLPRPYYEVSKSFINKSKINLARVVPIPWQSKAVFTENPIPTVFNVIEENEKRVCIEGLCGYCGIKFEDYDKCIRWIGTKPLVLSDLPNDGQGPRVFSDTHPLHLECMKQARIFCPFMRIRSDLEFEYGIFSELKKTCRFNK
jgi:hypothetical protein